MAFGIWAQHWEESERGWGTRPDGIWLYPTEEAAKVHTNAMLVAIRTEEAKRGYSADNVPEEYSRPCGSPVFIAVTEEVMKRVEREGKVHVRSLKELTASMGSSIG